MKPALIFTALVLLGNAGRQQPLRVCSDPDNLPFSNTAGQGFENQLADLAGRELNRRIVYTWFPERKAFVRKSLAAGQCDVVVGITSGFPKILTTRPYYRSTYVFVSRKNRHLRFASLPQDALRKLRVGVQIVGDDLAPPAHALARGGIIQNVRGYPRADIFHAVETDAIDVAIVWGPFAGYFSKGRPLTLEPIPASLELPALPFSYDIAMGVREDAPALRADLDGVIARKSAEIHKLLAGYGVPVVPGRTP